MLRVIPDVEDLSYEEIIVYAKSDLARRRSIGAVRRGRQHTLETKQKIGESRRRAWQLQKEQQAAACPIDLDEPQQ